MWEGVASLGLFAPFPYPPASNLQRGWAGSSLEFLSPFVLRTASSVFRPVNFSLLSHGLKKLPPTALRAFGPVLTLSNAARSSPFRPHLLVAGAGVWGTFLLGAAFRHVICGPYLIFPPSFVALRDLKTSLRPASARVSWWLETSSIKTPFPGLDSVPRYFVSLFIFYILSYLPSKTMGCFSGRLMSAASDQKLFCELCSPFNCSFDEFVREKVVSPSYSSTILTPPSTSVSMLVFSSSGELFVFVFPLFLILISKTYYYFFCIYSFVCFSYCCSFPLAVNL